MHLRLGRHTCFVAALVCATVLATGQSATADQSFVCNDGSFVTVALADLSHMKQTNACVAGYFPVMAQGQKMPGRAVADAPFDIPFDKGATRAIAFASPAALLQPKAPPLPEQAERSQQRPSEPLIKQQTRLPGAPWSIDDNGVHSRVIETGSVRVSNSARAMPAAVPSSDYRRVVILNAERGAPRYHFHTR